VRQTESHGAHGHAGVDKRREAFQLVVAGLVKEVAEADGAGGFSDKIHRQTSRAAGEYAGHGIQFTAAAGEVRASDKEVGGRRRAYRGEENGVVAIPEVMLRIAALRALDVRARNIARGRDRGNQIGLHRGGEGRILSEQRAGRDRKHSQDEDCSLGPGVEEMISHDDLGPFFLKPVT